MEVFMTVDEVTNYYGNGYLFHKKSGMAAGTYHNWVRKGFVPLDSQVRIERLTNGELKASLDHVDSK